MNKASVYVKEKCRKMPLPSVFQAAKGNSLCVSVCAHTTFLSLRSKVNNDKGESIN